MQRRSRPRTRPAAQGRAHVRSQAADQMDVLTEQLRQAQAELANRTMQIQRDADVRIEVARIAAESKERIAEIQRASNAKLDGLKAKMDS